MQPLLAVRRKFSQARQFRLEEGIVNARRSCTLQRGSCLGQAQPRRFASPGNGHLAGSGFLRGGLGRGRLRRGAGAADHLGIEQLIGLDVTGECILGLDQEPCGLALLAAAAHQMPATLEPLAEQLETQVALLQLRLGVAFGGPYAGVELIDMALAVTVFNIAFETGVGHRVIFDLHRQTLHLRVIAGALGHRPAFQCVAHLQAEVEVAAAGVVQLHHEDRAPVTCRNIIGRGFACLREIALAPVVPQAVHRRPFNAEEGSSNLREGKLSRISASSCAARRDTSQSGWHVAAW